jgi:type VI protein secretion system component Hcp
METIMSKNNDPSKLNHAALEDHGILADSELDAVTGGTPKLYQACTKGTHMPEATITV